MNDVFGIKSIKMLINLVLIWTFACLFNLGICQQHFFSDISLENIQLIESRVTMNSGTPQTFHVKDTNPFFVLGNKIHTPVSIHHSIGLFFYSLDDKPRSRKVYDMISPINSKKNADLPWN